MDEFNKLGKFLQRINESTAISGNIDRLPRRLREEDDWESTAEDINGNAPVFGDGDGWNEELLSDAGLLDVLSDAGSLLYEIKNAVRGSGYTGGDDDLSMIYAVESLKDDLASVYENLQDIYDQSR